MEDFHFEAETLMFQEAGLNSDPDMGKLRVSLPVYSSLIMLNTITGALVQWFTFTMDKPWNHGSFKGQTNCEIYLLLTRKSSFTDLVC